MDEEQTSESLEAKIRELEEDIEEIHELLEKPEDDVVQILELERGERQVIVHWIDESEADPPITDLAGAEEAFKYADPVEDPYVAGGSGRAIGHGDLMVMDTGECRYIAYVVNVDRVDPDSSGIQAEAPTDNHAVSVPDSVARGDGKPKKDLIVWSTCTGEGGGDPCSHDHDPPVSVTQAVIGASTSVTPVDTVTSVEPSFVEEDTPVQTSEVTVTGTETAHKITNVTKNTLTMNITAGGSEAFLASATANTTTTDVQLPSDTLVNPVPTGFTPSTTNVQLPSDTLVSPIPDGYTAALVNPQTLGNTHTYDVDGGTLTPVYEESVEVCIDGTACTLKILATEKDCGSGNVYDANTKPDGWFFKPVDDDGDPATDKIPRITIPRDDVAITPSVNVVNVPQNWSQQSVVTGLTPDGTVNVPQNWSQQSVVTDCTVDTTSGVNNAITSVAGSATSGLFVTDVTYDDVTVEQYDSTPKTIKQYNITSVPASLVTTASPVDVPDVTAGSDVSVAGPKKACDP